MNSLDSILDASADELIKDMETRKANLARLRAARNVRKAKDGLDCVADPEERKRWRSQIENDAVAIASKAARKAAPISDVFVHGPPSGATGAAAFPLLRLIAAASKASGVAISPQLMAELAVSDFPTEYAGLKRA